MFSVSLSLLFIGFVMLLAAYEMTYVLDIVRDFQVVGLLLAGFCYSAAIDDATSRRPGDSHLPLYLIVTSSITLVLWQATAWYLRRKGVALRLSGFRRYVFVSVACCIPCYLWMTLWVENQASDWVAAPWSGMVLITVLSSLLGWSLLFVAERGSPHRGKKDFREREAR